jgi:hypothetical protein
MGLAEKVAFLRRQSMAPASTSTPSPYNPTGGYGPYDPPKGDPAGHGFTPLPRLGGSRQPAASVASERPDRESALRAAAGHEYFEQMAPDFVMMASYTGPARPSRPAGAGPDMREAPVRGPVGMVDPSQSTREAPRREQLQVGPPPVRADGGQARADGGQARADGGLRFVDITDTAAEPPTTAQLAEQATSPTRRILGFSRIRDQGWRCQGSSSKEKAAARSAWRPPSSYTKLQYVRELRDGAVR